MKSLTIFFAALSFCMNVIAQTPTKQQQMEEMRKLQQQMKEEQKTIRQQMEWNNQDAQQEIKKLSTENQQKNSEIKASKSEAARAKAEMMKAVSELNQKQQELASTQRLIDSAKIQLEQTQAQLQTSEMIVKRTLEEKQRQEDSLMLLKKEQEVKDFAFKAQQAELNVQKAKNTFYITIAIVAVSLMSVIGIMFISRQKTLKELANKNKLIEEEQRKSNELLLNILPEEVMNELKLHGKTQARNYGKATVLFADIKDFTIISEQLSPDDLIEGLDAYFEIFDKVIERHEIEKIKTIGDAYVCAGGVPVKNEGNPFEVVKAALEMVEEIEKLDKKRLAAGKKCFSFRIGIHTGPLVAGIIGLRKFAYDIWGDTVNTAARMQQGSEPNKINISGATYELIKNDFACVYRGKLEAKNKGEIDMYFVEKVIV
jgi:adenylate cyclase